MGHQGVNQGGLCRGTCGSSRVAGKEFQGIFLTVLFRTKTKNVGTTSIHAGTGLEGIAPDNVFLFEKHYMSTTIQKGQGSRQTCDTRSHYNGVVSQFVSFWRPNGARQENDGGHYYNGGDDKCEASSSSPPRKSA